MPYTVKVIKLEGHPDGVTPQAPAEIFSQTVENLDLSRFVAALNKPARVRRSRNITAAKTT